MEVCGHNCMEVNVYSYYPVYVGTLYMSDRIASFPGPTSQTILLVPRPHLPNDSIVWEVGPGNEAMTGHVAAIRGVNWCEFHTFDSYTFDSYPFIPPTWGAILIAHWSKLSFCPVKMPMKILTTI